MTFLNEILQQPNALLNLLNKYMDDKTSTKALIDTINNSGCKEFIFTGMGSSYYAGFVACALLQKNGIKAHAYESKEFASYGLHTLNENTVIFVVSQSGECKELIDLFPLLQHKENVFVITNNENSSLYNNECVKFMLYAGNEVTTSTKTYTNTVAVMLFICEAILQYFNKPNSDFSSLIIKCSKIMQEVINNGAGQMVRFFDNADYICLVGSGPSYCTANHCELVIEEAGKMFSTRYRPAQFLHGPVELINEKFNIIAFDFSDDTRDEIDRIIDNELAYNGKICVITNRVLKNQSDRMMSIKLDIQNEFYSPLVEVIPVELFINELALNRGLKPGVLERVRK